MPSRKSRFIMFWIVSPHYTCCNGSHVLALHTLQSVFSRCNALHRLALCYTLCNHRCNVAELPAGLRCLPPALRLDPAAPLPVLPSVRLPAIPNARPRARSTYFALDVLVRVALPQARRSPRVHHAAVQRVEQERAQHQVIPLRGSLTISAQLIEPSQSPPCHIDQYILLPALPD